MLCPSEFGFQIIRVLEESTDMGVPEVRRRVVARLRAGMVYENAQYVEQRSLVRGNGKIRR